MDDFIIPPALLAEIQAAADDEHRPAAEVVREALEAYLEGRLHRMRDAESRNARGLGLPDDDVPVTPEYRRTTRDKSAQGMQSLRAGKSVDGETFFARMEAEFDELEQQGHE